MYLCIIYIICSILLILFVFNRLTCGYNKSATCLAGKTALVTGGNSGIGFQVALMLASRGCKVIIADKDNAEETRKKIISKTNNSNIVIKYLNLASFKCIRKFVDDIKRTEKELHVLINNAGVGNVPSVVTEDGIGSILQINYFGPFLLTHLLIDLLKQSAPSRIVFTSSIQAFVTFSEDNLNPLDYNVNNRIKPYFLYGNSKLYTIIASNWFASKLKPYNITSNSLHPGSVRTQILSKSLINKMWYDTIMDVSWSMFNYVVGKSAWEGAQTTLHVATSEECESVTGKYFWDCKVFPFVPSRSKDRNFCKYLWTESEKLVQLNESETLK